MCIDIKGGVLNSSLCLLNMMTYTHWIELRCRWIYYIYICEGETWNHTWKEEVVTN
jgi:hypothetical protein